MVTLVTLFSSSSWGAAMQQRPTVRARVMRVSLSLLLGLAAVALPLWALGPGFDGGSSDNPAADLPVGDGNASLTSLIGARRR